MTDKQLRALHDTLVREFHHQIDSAESRLHRGIKNDIRAQFYELLNEGLRSEFRAEIRKAIDERVEISVKVKEEGQ